MDRRNFLSGTLLGGVLSRVFAPGNTFAQAPAAPSTEEYRLMDCAVVENQPLTAGNTKVLADLAGPGSVELLQLAIIGTTGPDPSRVTYDSILRITVDGSVIMQCDVGTFFLTHGAIDTTDTNTWTTDNLGVTQCRGITNQHFGAFRRLFIPYNMRCLIEVLNISAGSTGYVFSQVQFRSGAAPSLTYAPRRSRLQVAVTPFTSLNFGQGINLLPNVRGRGVIDSIQMVVHGKKTDGGDTYPWWLEGNPTVLIDGKKFSYGGTEDFFGTQSYGMDALGKQSDSWGIPMNRPFAFGYVTGMYRFFHKDPLPFDTSAKFRWFVGPKGPPLYDFPVNVSALVFYYLDR